MTEERASYAKDQTYINLAHQALEINDPVLRDLPELKRLVVVEPTPWGDPQLVLTIDSSVPVPRRLEIRDMVQGVPVVFKFDREQ